MDFRTSFGSLCGHIHNFTPLHSRVPMPWHVTLFRSVSSLSERLYTLLLYKHVLFLEKRAGRPLTQAMWRGTHCTAMFNKMRQQCQSID
jgi:hypothetical protein